MAGIDNSTLANLPNNLEDQLALRNFLGLVIQQIDIIVGNRKITTNYTAVKVEPSVVYSQIEAAAVASNLFDVHKRLESLEARLTSINN